MAVLVALLQLLRTSWCVFNPQCWALPRLLGMAGLTMLALMSCQRRK